MLDTCSDNALCRENSSIITDRPIIRFVHKFLSQLSPHAVKLCNCSIIHRFKANFSGVK